MKNILSIILIILLVGGVYAQFSTINQGNNYNSPTFTQDNYYAGYNTQNYNTQTYQGTNNIQSTNPMSYNRFGGSSMGSYWPQFQTTNQNMQNCNGATTDFLVTIPPGGCTPNVVRSDLLAEQNVPIFCKLSTLRLNPLIDVSAIRSISFTGNYPKGVSGVSYHPARQAVRSYNTVISSPATDNAGYVVITLSRQADEREIQKWIEGNLTARISYDSRRLFGAGKGEYYLEAGDKQVPFWNGKGYLEVEDIDNDIARINLYVRRDASAYKTFTLQEGQLTPLIYFPGYYCSAGLRVKLNRIVAPDNMALLNIEGNQFWVREGSRFLDNKCTVKKINILSGGSGDIDVSCTGKKFSLTLEGRGVLLNNGEDTREYNVGDQLTNNADGKDYYLAYYGKDSFREDFIIVTNKEVDKLDIAFINNHFEGTDWSKYSEDELMSSIGNNEEGKKRIGELDKDYFFLSPGGQVENIEFNSLTSDNEDTDPYNINYELDKGEEIVRELIDFYPTEEKFEGTYWGEEALFQQITLSGQAGHADTQMNLIELFEETYPSSDYLETVLELKRQGSLYDYSDAHTSIQINNEYFNIFVESFRAERDLDKSATIRIGGRSAEFVRQGDTINLDDGNLTIEEIKVKGIQFRFTPNEGTSQGRFVGINSYGIVGSREIEVKDVETRKVAYVSIEPEIRKTHSQADFSFKIGVEERNIQLNPDKTREAIKGLNQTIAMWENMLEKLGNTIKVWKAVCFATSTILMLETMLSGFSGESLARGKVMTQYKTICDIEIGKGTYSTRTECYNAISENIDKDVESMTQGINAVNSDLKKVQQGNTQTSGILGKETIINQTKYVEDLKKELEWEGVEIDGTKVETKDLTKSTEIRKVMLYKKLGCKVDKTICRDNPASNVACCTAFNEMTAGLKSAAIQKKADKEGERISVNVREVVGGSTVPRIQTVNSKNVKTLTWNGEKGKDFSNLPSEIGQEDKIQFLNLNGKTYLLKLRESTLGGTMGIDKAYKLNQKSWEQITNLAKEDLDKFVFMGGSKEACSNNIIKNPEVRYYESGRNKGLPALVPFDIEDGWYVHVPNSYGSALLEGTPKTYTAAGDVNFFWICNAGKNGIVEQKTGDDLCQSFSSNQMGFDTFISCGLQGKEVGQLYSKARNAISQAASAYGRKGYVDILGQNIRTGNPVSDTGNTECQDFMSPSDCKMLFNACDPVICPSSRCDLGGKYPVSDVVQTGIIGSIALCLPNAREGIIFPVCLTGIHAGIDAFVSILKSEKECMQHNLDTGQYIGICDEITAIYMCEFFWRNFGSLLDVLLPSFFESAFGQPTTRGGGEYQSVQSAWDNLGKSMEFFTGFYAENAMTAFQLRNSQNIGTEVCNGFLGTSMPLSLSAEGFDALLAPQSPTQFYAYFSEVPFTDATSPATSHYKVYYHIYAGNDFGASYQVYLKNPPASGFYATMPSANVKTGFVARGQSADEAIDFTAPAGYKELCVRINNEEYCGFGTVSSNFAVNYATEKYTEDQATKTDIVSESECVSTSQSTWALAAPNIQAGAEKAIGGQDINLAGITRICATQNPQGGVAAERNNVICNSNADCGSGYFCQKTENSEIGNCVDNNGNTQRSAGRWVDVGYCDDPNIRCWLDSSTLKGRFDAINAVNQEIYGQNGTVMDYVKYGQMFEELQQSYQLARAKLSEQYNKIIKLTPSKLRYGDANLEIDEILRRLDEIIGVYEVGEGTSNNKAEALALKATVYRMIAEQKMRDGGDLFTGTIEPEPQLTSSDTSTGTTPLDTSGAIVNTQPPQGTPQEFFTIKNNYIFYSETSSPYYIVEFSSGNQIIRQDGSSKTIGTIDSTTKKITINNEFRNVGIGRAALGELNNFYYIDGDIALRI